MRGPRIGPKGGSAPVAGPYWGACVGEAATAPAYMRLRDAPAGGWREAEAKRDNERVLTLGDNCHGKRAEGNWVDQAIDRYDVGHVQEVIRQAHEELRQLLHQRAEIMKRIGTVKQTISGLANCSATAC